jgi:hypothetical protein
MMSMMREKLSHAAERVAALKTELKITEAQTPAWMRSSRPLSRWKLQGKPCTSK